MDTLKLYRGDFEKIKQYDFHKTNKNCYVGPGVYLTSKVAVAESYRTKGNYDSKNPNRVLFDGKAKDRNDAYEKGFAYFFERYYLADLFENRPDLKKSVTNKDKLKPTSYSQYRMLIADGKIKADYTSSPNRFGSNDNCTLKVVYDVPLKDGYVTEFSFEKVPFEASVIRIDRPIKDPTFWEIMFDHEATFGRPTDDFKKEVSRSDYINLNVNKPPVWQGVNNFLGTVSFDQKDLPAIRRAIQPYGYRGFEYTGGSVIGGFGNHRAFCIWDDDYVNEHRVRRFR